MTPAQVRAIGILSALATVLVLAAGRGFSDTDMLLAAALQQRETVTAKVLAGARVAQAGDD